MKGPVACRHPIGKEFALHCSPSTVVTLTVAPTGTGPTLSPAPQIMALKAISIQCQQQMCESVVHMEKEM